MPLTEPIRLSGFEKVMRVARIDETRIDAGVPKPFTMTMVLINRLRGGKNKVCALDGVPFLRRASALPSHLVPFTSPDSSHNAIVKNRILDRDKDFFEVDRCVCKANL
jgi:hypothetical protein